MRVKIGVSREAKRSFYRSVNAILGNALSNATIDVVLNFYRAMHFSAKRGLAIACRPSVRLSVCDVGGL